MPVCAETVYKNEAACPAVTGRSPDATFGTRQI